VATLPVGYNDGLSYRLSNRGRALVNGTLAPIIGSISMDYTMLDVGHIPGVRTGDTVTLVGRDGTQEIGVPELASLIGTIAYEICCSVGKRVRRVYVRPEREGEGAACDVELPGAVPVQLPAPAVKVQVAAAGASLVAESPAAPSPRVVPVVGGGRAPAPPLACQAAPAPQPAARRRGQDGRARGVSRGLDSAGAGPPRRFEVSIAEWSNGYVARLCRRPKEAPCAAKMSLTG
jgi:hypothetical protein